MYIYYCPKCNGFDSFEEEAGKHMCPSCNVPFVALKATVDDWNNMSNDQMLATIEKAKKPVKIKTPEFKKEEQKIAATPEMDDDFHVDDLNAPKLKKKVGKDASARNKILFGILGAVAVIAIIAAIVISTSSGVSKVLKNDTNFTNTQLDSLEKGASYVNSTTIHLLYLNAAMLSRDYNALSQEDKDKYDAWAGKEYGTSFSSIMKKVESYGIDVTKNDYTDAECETLYEAYKNNGNKAPYSEGVAAGNVPDPGATKYSEAEITLVALDNGLRKETDDYEGTNIFYSERTPKRLTEAPPIYAAITNKGDQYALGCMITYRGSHWVFFETLTVKINGEIVDFPLPKEPKRDTVSDGVKEYLSVEAAYGDTVYNILKNLGEQNGTEIKFKGEKSKVMELSAEDCKAIKDVIDAYDIIRAGKKENLVNN